MIDTEHAIYTAVEELLKAARSFCEMDSDDLADEVTLLSAVGEIEQLAERVRLGYAWFACKICQGTGWQPHFWEREKPHYTGRKCWRCNGDGLLNGLDTTPNAPCPCHEPNGGPPCTPEKPCLYGEGKPREAWRVAA